MIFILNINNNNNYVRINITNRVACHIKTEPNRTNNKKKKSEKSPLTECSLWKRECFEKGSKEGEEKLEEKTKDSPNLQVAHWENRKMFFSAKKEKWTA